MEKPDFAKINGGSGRSIEGLPVVHEKFSRLEEAKDYDLVLRNQYVASDRDLKDFVYFINPKDGDLVKEIAPPHWRATAERGVFSEAIIPFAKDKKSVPFFTVGVKGVGYLKPSVLGKNLSDYESWISEETTPGQEGEVKALGISGKIDYFLYRNQNIMDRSIFLTSQGLRTELYWGVEKLKNLYYQGELKSIKELRDTGVIPKERPHAPHMAQRLMKTNSRVEEVFKSEERRGDLFKEAFAVFNAEAEHYGDHKLNIESPEDQKEFARVFIRRMAENMAVLLNTGYMHTYAHSANVTLAAEIVDIGPMAHFSEDKRIKSGYEQEYNGLRLGHIKDMRDIVYSIKRMMRAMEAGGMSRPRKSERLDALLAAFDGKADEGAMRLQGVEIDTARRWFRGIAKAVLVDNERLHSLRNYSIEEWPELEM